MAGSMNVQIQYCDGMQHHGLFRQDPYAIIVVGGREVRTQPARRGDTNPVFDQAFDVPYNGEEEAQVIIKDHELVFQDEFVGRGAISLVPLRERPGQAVPVAVQLYTKDGEPRGQAHLVLTFTPGYGAVVPPPQPYAMPAQTVYGAPSQPGYGAPPSYAVPPGIYAAPPIVAGGGGSTTVVVEEGHKHHHHHHHYCEEEVVVETTGGMPVAPAYGVPSMGGSTMVVQQDPYMGGYGGGDTVVVEERRGPFGRQELVEERRW